MTSKSNNPNVHFDPKVRKMTIDMWLAGKSPYEIEYAIQRAAYARIKLYNKSKRHRYRVLEGESV